LVGVLGQNFLDHEGLDSLDVVMNELAESVFLEPTIAQRVLLEHALQEGRVPSRDRAFASSVVDHLRQKSDRSKREDDFYKKYLGDEYVDIQRRGLAAKLAILAKDHLLSLETACPREARRARSVLQDIFEQKYSHLIKRSKAASQEYEQASQKEAEFLNRHLSDSLKEELLGNAMRDVNASIVKNLHPRYSDELNSIIVDVNIRLQKVKADFERADQTLLDTKKEFIRGVDSAFSGDLTLVRKSLKECQEANKEEYNSDVEAGGKVHNNVLEQDERFKSFMKRFGEYFQENPRFVAAGSWPIDAAFGSVETFEYLEKNLFS
jgi:hypothetical protein